MTNIIEQLGGYEKAKEYLKTLESIPMHEQTEDTIMWLPHELLEHRRQNNIYEEGDWIIYDDDLMVFAMLMMVLLSTDLHSVMLLMKK